ncbi:MAG: hypothetical protein NC313_02340 [Butyrivibrio sp.]|nr:hypothetical protein [Butyrivibrio sp.]
MSIKLSKNLSRFIVPFSYAVHGKADYEKLSRITTETNEALWTPFDFSKSECDLYDFVKPPLDSNLNKTVCHCYVINSNYRKALPDITVRFGKGKNNLPDIKLEIANVGLYLFESGVGFLWYQIETKTDSDLELIGLNNAIKEFSHHGSQVSCYQLCVKHLSTGISTQDCHSASSDMPLPEDAILLGSKKKVNKYFIHSQLPKEWDEQQEYAYYERNGEIWGRYAQEEEFRFVDWVMGFLEVLNVDDFFASREQTAGNQTRNIPDKAVLFNCVLQQSEQELGEEERKELLKHLFYLAKGYTTKYLVPDYYLQEEKDYYFIPFQNVAWYASEEGCAQLVNVESNGENKAFFENTYWSRQEIYFYIYILVLQQYYSLLKMNCKLSKLPKTLDGFRKKEARRLLTECREEINFLFTNTVYLKISHISHQNMLYSYLEERYGLNEMIDKLKEKITGLNSMVDTWYEDSKRKQMRTISIVGSIFVFIQTLSNILAIYDYLPWKTCISIWLFAALTLGIVVLISIFVAWIVDWK